MNKSDAIETTKKLIQDKFDPKPGFPGFGGIWNPQKTLEMYEGTSPEDFKSNLVEFEGEYKGYGVEENSILLNAGAADTIILITKDTFLSPLITGREAKGITSKDVLYVIAVKVEEYPIYIALSVLKADEKAYFGQIKSLYGKVKAIKNFYTLLKNSPDKQELIIEKTKGTKYKRFENSDNVKFESGQEQLLMYAMTKENYPEETQRAFEALFNDTNAKNHKTEQRLYYLSNIKHECKARKLVDRKEAGELFDKTFFGREKAKNQIIDRLVSNQRTKQKGCNFLIVGGTGTGSTSLARYIADVQNLPFESIQLGGMETPQELGGLDFGYESADAGKFVQVFVSAGTEIVVCLEKIDQIGRSVTDGNPLDVIQSALSGICQDKFLRASISTKNTTFVATAYSTDGFSEELLKCFDVIINLDDFSTEEKKEISKRFIIPKLCEKLAISPGNLEFQEDALDLLVTSYCEDGGLKDSEHHIESVLRHLVTLNPEEEEIVVSEKDVQGILNDYVNNSYGIILNKNIHCYTETVVKEARDCISKLKKAARKKGEEISPEKLTQKIEHLLACKNEHITYEETFDPVAFSNVLHSELYGMDNVIKEAVTFYHSAHLRGTMLTSNLALYGGYGVGKTAIAKAIAEAMKYKFQKISLNGVSDVKELRGFPLTYLNSMPGRIMKAVKEAKSLRTVFLLDEIDKLKPEMAYVLIDLLDRKFTDNFLDVEVDFSDAIFIATANDWANVPFVLRDRFSAIHCEGYTREEKTQILTKYIIPKIEKGYGTNHVTVDMEEEAVSYLLSKYCPSFGVRDVEKSMTKIVGNKLVDQFGGQNEFNVHISKEDVKKYLGNEPVPRGNFPAGGNCIGVSTALAVSNANMGSVFAIETVLLDGKEELLITGLAKETVVESVSIAVTTIKRLYPGLLNNKYLHIHFAEGSVPKDGPSAGSSILLSILSAAFKMPVMVEKPFDIACTGELGMNGIFIVGGVDKKIAAAAEFGCRKVFVPLQSYEELDKEKLKEYTCEVIPVLHVEELIREVFPNAPEMAAGL